MRIYLGAVTHNTLCFIRFFLDEKMAYEKMASKRFKKPSKLNFAVMGVITISFEQIFLDVTQILLAFGFITSHEKHNFHWLKIYFSHI
jgi:hypothetical protein